MKDARPRSKAIPTTRRAWARPTPTRRPRCCSSTIPDRVHRDHVPRRNPPLGHVRADHGAGVQPAPGGAGRRAAVSDRVGGVADAGQPAAGGAGRPSRRRSGTSGSPSTATTPTRGARLAFGEVVETTYRFDQARVVVVARRPTFSAPGPATSATRAISPTAAACARRKAEMNRLYVAETAPTPTGAIADHRLPARASQIEAIARALQAAVAGGGGGSTAGNAEFDKWVAAAAEGSAGQPRRRCRSSPATSSLRPCTPSRTR